MSQSYIQLSSISLINAGIMEVNILVNKILGIAFTKANTYCSVSPIGQQRFDTTPHDWRFQIMTVTLA